MYRRRASWPHKKVLAFGSDLGIYRTSVSRGVWEDYYISEEDINASDWENLTDLEVIERLGD
jgi:hypothetical protein